MKDVDLGEPTSFLDHVYLSCTQRQCQIGKDNVDNCIDDHQFKEEEIVGELSTVCSQIVGRPDFLWSLNKLARAITKLTKACNKRLARLISYIHHTSEYRKYCHVGNTAHQCRLGLFQDF